MAFSWLEFLKRHRIEFNTSGAHTHRGNVYIDCPFCNDSPGKRRMGLHLDSPKWGCWKTKRHAGPDPARLIHALLRCTWSEAIREADEGTPARTPVDEMRARLVRLESGEPTAPIEVRLPREFVPFEYATEPPLGYYRKYVQSRGFEGSLADDVARTYELYAGDWTTINGERTGRFDRRVIHPFRTIDGRLVGWSGRHIGRSELRYDTHGPTRDVLYNSDLVAEEGGRRLQIVEGPWDTIKVDYFGREHGVRCVGLIGLGGGGRSKAGLITRVVELGGFESVGVLLDATALGAATELVAALRHLDASIDRLPPGRKDPGVLTPADVARLAIR